MGLGRRTRRHRYCDTWDCWEPGYTFIWQVQVKGELGWTVLCKRHGSKCGEFRRDEVSRKLMVMGGVVL